MVFIFNLTINCNADLMIVSLFSPLFCSDVRWSFFVPKGCMTIVMEDLHKNEMKFAEYERSRDETAKLALRR